MNFSNKPSETVQLAWDAAQTATMFAYNILTLNTSNNVSEVNTVLLASTTSSESNTSLLTPIVMMLTNFNSEKFSLINL